MKQEPFFGLEEACWGLLPALICLPWLIWPHNGAGPAGGCFLLLAALMASFDVASRRIPNALTALGALCGLVWALVLGGPAALGQALLGGLIGFGGMALFFFLGMLGAGDVKAVAALATFLGPWGAAQLMVATALVGGVLAIAALVCSRTNLGFLAGGLGGLRLASKGGKLPYGLAIALGAWAVFIRGGIAWAAG